MPIPTYDALMLPVLRHCADKVWAMRDLVAKIGDDLALTAEERDRQLPSGTATLLTSRVHWAKTYLKQAGLVDQPKRGVVQITSAGRKLLATNPPRIDVPLLQTFESFRAFLSKTKVDADPTAQPLPNGFVEASSTPEEQINAASQTLDQAVREALLTRILEASPAFFEKLIVDLLLAMGYGGSRAEAGEQLGGSGDGGVDGVIREDQLGLDRIYLQAKRYRPGNTVGSEAVQAFIGALVGRAAQKGVFITTSAFSRSALDAASRSGSLRLVLIDGSELAKLMMRFNVGVRVARAVEIKRVDLDYFEEGDID